LNYSNNSKARLLKGKQDIFIATFNIRTLLNATQINELVASSETLSHDIICIQEHRFIHDDTLIKEHNVGKQWTLITSSAWKNSMNASIGGVGMLLSPRAYKALNKVESITPRIMVATFNGNPEATIISCYSPTNVHDESEVEKFYHELSSVTREVPKHNVLLLGGDYNAQLGQSEDHKHAYHLLTNRNGIMLNNFLKENKLSCLNTSFQKRPGQLWTYTSPNGYRAQLDYVIINRKWRNSAKTAGHTIRSMVLVQTIA
jgi:exonuclease III